MLNNLVNNSWRTIAIKRLLKTLRRGNVAHSFCWLKKLLFNNFARCPYLVGTTALSVIRTWQIFCDIRGLPRFVRKFAMRYITAFYLVCWIIKQFSCSILRNIVAVWKKRFHLLNPCLINKLIQPYKGASIRNILIKGPFKYLNDRFPYPFLYLSLWNPRIAHYTK